MKERLIQLIRSGETKEAFEEGMAFLDKMKEHYYKWTTLQSKYNEKLNDNLKGVVSSKEHNTDLNRINFELLDLIIKIDKDWRQIDRSETTRVQNDLLKEKLQNQLLDQYEILDPISEGTSTVLYKAKELFGNDYVAIRALKSESLYNVSQAFDEVTQLKKLNHRNIVSVLGNSNLTASPKYVVLEYIDGIDIASIIEDYGPRPIMETKRILLKICNALYYLHKRKLFNADLRASRIIIDKEGEPIISPFIVFRTNSQSSYDQILSNLRYMSYQRLNSIGYKNPTPSSNQFSIGVLAYLLSVGEPLFPENSLVDLIEARIAFENDSEYRRAKLEKLTGPIEFIAVIKRLLSQNRESRYPYMMEVIHALNNVNLETHFHNRISEESYSRACAFNSELTYELIRRINKEDIEDIEDLNTTEFAKRLHNIISLVIETNTRKSYLLRAIQSEELFNLFFTHRSEFIQILLELISEYDYLWSPKIEIAWRQTLRETFEKLDTKE